MNKGRTCNVCRQHREGRGIAYRVAGVPHWICDACEERLYRPKAAARRRLRETEDEGGELMSGSTNSRADIQLVPRQYGSCGAKHGLELEAHGDGTTVLRVCRCFEVRFPGHDDVNARVRSLEHDGEGGLQ